MKTLEQTASPYQPLTDNDWIHGVALTRPDLWGLSHELLFIGSISAFLFPT